jgi:hypothetical protein
VTEHKNEELLKILFSMMMFTQGEITDLQSTRSALTGKVGKQKSNVKQNTSGEKSFEGLDSTKKKKGIFGSIFKQKSDSMPQPQPPMPKSNFSQ